MAGNEVSLTDQVGRLDAAVSETQMRHGNTAGLLGVVIKVCLSVHISVITDDLDGVLVSTYRTVSAKTPELTVGCSLWSSN